MGWKSTVRTITTEIHRAEREAQRKRRELERQRKQQLKMMELERAAYEVEVYNNHIDVLLSIHKDCGNPIDWQAIRAANPPSKPEKPHAREKAAREKLEKYKPGILDKIRKREDERRKELAQNVERMRQEDEEEYQRLLDRYQKECSEWEETQEHATKVLAGDPDALVEVIEEVNPFGEISELGSSLEFQGYEAGVIEATLHVNSEEVVPKEVKSLLKSGKLSVKEMPKSKFNELYQDYVCGSVLRIARELFALLPIQTVLVTALGNLLNTRTGHIEEMPILSVFIPRDTLDKLSFQALDPSDAMENFVHRMDFKKTKGFGPVTNLELSDLLLSE